MNSSHQEYLLQENIILLANKIHIAFTHCQQVVAPISINIYQITNLLFSMDIIIYINTTTITIIPLCMSSL